MTFTYHNTVLTSTKLCALYVCAALSTSPSVWAASVVPENVYEQKITPPSTKSVAASNRVIPLVDGQLVRRGDGQVTKTASVTLVQSLADGSAMVVDSAAATDFANTERLLKNLAMLNVSTVSVRFVVTTHGHPDHFGQSNFFQNADHFFGAFENRANNYRPTQLAKASAMRLTDSISLWSTPGHTTDDISVVVTSVEGLGTVGIVGDLFYSEEDALSADGGEWMHDALSAYLGVHNRRKVICATDYVVPGHSHMFRVTEEMRQKYSCGTNTSTTYLLIQPSPPPLTSVPAIGLPVERTFSVAAPSAVVYRKYSFSPPSKKQPTINASTVWNTGKSGGYPNLTPTRPSASVLLTPSTTNQSTVVGLRPRRLNYPGNYNVMSTSAFTANLVAEGDGAPPSRPLGENLYGTAYDAGQRLLLDYLRAARPGAPVPTPNIGAARIYTRQLLPDGDVVESTPP